MANRYQQLIALTPRGSFYQASGVVLPWRDAAYEFLFSPVPASHTFSIFDNDQARGQVTSDALGSAIVSIILDQGYHRLTIIDQLDQAQFNSYVTVRASATIQVAHAEAIESIDASNDEIQQSLSLGTATQRFIEDVFGKPLQQPNDFGSWITNTYRALLRWLRQAFRIFGSKLTGVRQGVFAYTSSLPLRVPRAWRPWWRLGTQLAPNGDLQSYARVLAAPLTNLNARSIDFVHAAYLATAPNIFPGPFANPPNGAEILRIRFSVGWDGGSVTVTGTDASSVAATDVFTPIAAQPLVSAEDVDGTIPFLTITGATKTIVGTGGTASIGLSVSRFIMIDDIGDLNSLGGATLFYLTAPDRLRWFGAGAPAIDIPVDDQYELRSPDAAAQWFGLVPEPGGGYIVITDHYMRIEADDLGEVLIDLSNESFNAGAGFGGGASPRTQAQIATSINNYFTRDTRYGAVTATGTISCPSGAAIAAFDPGNAGTATVTLSDGVNPVLIFQFFVAPVAAAAVGNILVRYTAADTVSVIAAKLAIAINNGFNDFAGTANPGAGGAMRISAASNVTVVGDVTLMNDFGGTQGNIALATTFGGFVLVGMAGGVNSPAYAAFASAAVGLFSNAVRFLAAVSGDASTVRQHPTGASAMRTVLGVPRHAAVLIGAPLALRAVLVDLAAGHRLPQVVEAVILHAAFADTLAVVTTLFTQPTYPIALEVFFSAAWRGATLRVSGTAFGGAAQSELFVPPASGVDSGAAASSADGVTITLGGGETFDGIEQGMFFRRTTDGLGAYVRYVQNVGNTIVLEAPGVPGFPWGPVAWTITRNVVAKGTLAFESVVQIDNLALGGAGTAGAATLSIIDGALHGYDVRIGRDLRAVGAATGVVTPLDATRKTAAFTAVGALVSELQDLGGELHIRGATFDSTTNVGLHRVFSLGTPTTPGISSIFIRHQDADHGGRFSSEILPGGSTWRLWARGEVVRVVGVNVATGDLTLYPPGVSFPYFAGQLVELESEMPHTAYGVDGPRTLTVTVDKALVPAGAASDALTFGGTTVPDGWRVFSSAAPLIDIPGFFVPARLQALASGALDIGSGLTDWILQRELRSEDVITYRGFLIRTKFWAQAHFTGGGSFRIDYSFNGAAFVAGTSVPGSSATNPQAIAATMLFGTGSSGVLDPRFVEAQIEVPFDATTCTVRLRLLGAAITNPVSIEKCVVLAVPSTGLYLGNSTIPLSEHRAKFGEVLYVWSSEAFNAAEQRGLGVPTFPASQPERAGTIDRIVNAHGIWDRYDVSEYTSGMPVNVLGAYDEIGWGAATLTNMEMVIGTPPRMTTVKPLVVSLVTEDLTFTAPSNAALLEASAHEGVFPEESFEDELLVEDGIPVPATPSVGGGVLPWRFLGPAPSQIIQVASAGAGDPAGQQIFNAAGVYEITYRRLMRAETVAFDLGAAFADYLWLVDATIYRRRQPTSSTFPKLQSLTFGPSFRAPLDTPSDRDVTTSVLVRDTGIVRTELPVATWRYINQSTIEINAGEFDATAIFSFSYRALLPGYPAPAVVTLEHRSSSVSLADVLLQTYAVVDLDELVNRAHRFHQMRVTLRGVVDVRDVEIAGLGLRGLHLYGAAAFAPGILE